MIAQIEDFLRTGREPAPAPPPPVQRRRDPRRFWWRPSFLLAVSMAVIVGAGLFIRTIRPAGDGPDHASAAAAGPGYTFLKVNRSGTPVRWNPCARISYQVNLTAAPAYALSDLEAAMEQISAATGLSFRAAGVTDQFPLFGPDLGPSEKAVPVQIAWADPAEDALLQADGMVAGTMARTAPVELVDEVTDHGLYVTGSIVVRPSASRLPEGFGPGGLGNLWLAQLGHLVGLGSVSSPGEVMSSAEPFTQSGLGAGDRAGLARLGSVSGCLQKPAEGSYEPAF